MWGGCAYCTLLGGYVGCDDHVHQSWAFHSSGMGSGRMEEGNTGEGMGGSDKEEGGREMRRRSGWIF